jgi:hypothetical protein
MSLTFFKEGDLLAIKCLQSRAKAAQPQSHTHLVGQFGLLFVRQACAALSLGVPSAKNGVGTWPTP